MSLSDRVRPGVEAAPWVVDEIKALEDKIPTVARFGGMSVENIQAMAGAARLCGNADILQTLSEAFNFECLAAFSDNQGCRRTTRAMGQKAEEKWAEAIRLAKP